MSEGVAWIKLIFNVKVQGLAVLSTVVNLRGF